MKYEIKMSEKQYCSLGKEVVIINRIEKAIHDGCEERQSPKHYTHPGLRQVQETSNHEATEVTVIAAE